MKDIMLLQGLRHAYARRYEPESMRRLAEAYWGIVMSIAALGLVGTVGYGLWEFLLPSSEIMAENSAAPGITGFDKAQLKSLVETYEGKRVEFEALMKK